jgi:hypothetical protein
MVITAHFEPGVASEQYFLVVTAQFELDVALVEYFLK